MSQDAPRPLREQPRINVPSGPLAPREPIMVSAQARDVLRHFLQAGPGAATGIGYSEFILHSIRMWQPAELRRARYATPVGSAEDDVPLLVWPPARDQLIEFLRACSGAGPEIDAGHFILASVRRWRAIEESAPS
jgi:hypothetical protein